MLQLLRPANSQKVAPVIPANAGIQGFGNLLDLGFRRGDDVAFTDTVILARTPSAVRHWFRREPLMPAVQDPQ